MLSPKQNTQRRMLSPKNNRLVGGTGLAKIAARSPTSTSRTKLTENRPSLTSKKSPLKQPTMTRTKSPSINEEYQIRSARQQKTTTYSNQKPAVVTSHTSRSRAQSQLKSEQVKLANGDYYQGDIVGNSTMEGKGTYYFYNDNLKYVGDFMGNQFHGWGVLMRGNTQGLNSEQVLYEGEWQYGKKHGKGKHYYGADYYQSNHTSKSNISMGSEHFYNGQWQNDMKHGKGLYQDHSGLYNGQWFQNRQEGQGSWKSNLGQMSSNDMIECKGHFTSGQFVKGLIRYANGDEYSGDIRNGQRQGEGTYFSVQSQERYRGQWKNNLRNGKGTLIMKNGDELQCNFINSQVDWTQSCTYKWNSGPDAGSIFNGWFKNGNPQKGHVIQANGEQYDTY